MYDSQRLVVDKSILALVIPLLGSSTLKNHTI